tara:strand:- start:9277 stop:9615 length:339 start_codon:yes stop_codon:yes gene_type:complete
MAKFQIIQTLKGLYYFRLKASNGEIILRSEAYTSKQGCLNGIESVKYNSREDGNYITKTSSNGKYYFNLKARNGEIVGTSEMYNTKQRVLNGIEFVKTNASNAQIIITVGSN